MQKALSYRTTGIATATGGSSATRLLRESQQPGQESNRSVSKLVSENAVIAFGRSGCCMCFVLKQLLLGHGVNPIIYFVDEDDEAAVLGELSKISGGVDCGVSGGDAEKLQLPAVFLGGKLFGGLERVMSTHITGELVPMLREARALWL